MLDPLLPTPELPGIGCLKLHNRIREFYGQLSLPPFTALACSRYWCYFTSLHAHHTPYSLKNCPNVGGGVLSDSPGARGTGSGLPTSTLPALSLSVSATCSSRRLEPPEKGGWAEARTGDVPGGRAGDSASPSVETGGGRGVSPLLPPEATAVSAVGGSRGSSMLVLRSRKGSMARRVSRAPWSAKAATTSCARAAVLVFESTASRQEPC